MGDERAEAASPLHPPAAGPLPHEWGGFAAAAGQLAGQAGLLFGWSPDTFWRATPAELAALAGALSGDAAAAPMSGGELAGLMERFPDG